MNRTATANPGSEVMESLSPLLRIFQELAIMTLSIETEVATHGGLELAGHVTEIPENMKAWELKPLPWPPRFNGRKNWVRDIDFTRWKTETVH